MHEVNIFIKSKGLQFREKRRKKLIEWMLMDIIKDKIWKIIDQSIEKPEFDKFIDEIYKKKIDPYSVAEEIVRRIDNDN